MTFDYHIKIYNKKLKQLGVKFYPWCIRTKDKSSPIPSYWNIEIWFLGLILKLKYN